MRKLFVPANALRTRVARVKSQIRSDRSHALSSIRAVFALFTLIFGLVGATVARPAEVCIGRSSAAPAWPPVAAVLRVNPKTVEAFAGFFESIEAALPAPDGQRASLPAGPGGENVPQYQQANLLGDLKPSFSTLLVLFCILLLVGIGYTVHQLYDAHGQLERRTVDLSASNKQLKREVTERRLTENALRVSENFYYSLVETVPQNIFRKDAEGKYTFANRAFCAALGKSEAEIVGKTDQDILPAELAARFRREDEQLLAAGKQVESEQVYPMPSGGKIRVQMIKTPLFDSEARPLGIQGIFWDINERKRDASQLEAVHRQLIEASRRVGMAEVATGVLHNVGNVLNSVNVSASLVYEQVEKSKVLNLGKVAYLLSEHAGDGKYLTEDERGKQLPGYLKDLAEDCAADKVYEFMFVAPAIPITGAVGSPTNPLAIK